MFYGSPRSQDLKIIVCEGLTKSETCVKVTQETSETPSSEAYPLFEGTSGGRVKVPDALRGPGNHHNRQTACRVRQS
jgi:hypothetical protein